jgi:hypothetical protein
MITITSLWIAAVALLLFFLARSVRTVHRALRCPLRGTDVQVSFLEAEPEGRPIDVIACSEFRPEAAITCDRRCRALLGRRAMPPAARAESGTRLVTGAPEDAPPAVELRSV